MKLSKTVLYYAVLATVVAANIAQTLVLGSIQVAHGSSLRTFELSEQTLERSLSSLEQSKSSHVSLASAQEFAGTRGFVTITKPVVVGISTTVASR